MKIYLPIEVPEDFETGCCGDCPLSTYDGNLCNNNYIECPLLKKEEIEQ